MNILGVCAVIPRYTSCYKNIFRLNLNKPILIQNEFWILLDLGSTQKPVFGRFIHPDYWDRVKISFNSLLLKFPIQFSPVDTVIFARFFLD